jgi:hypothetical protein
MGQGYRREQWEQFEKSMADEELRALSRKHGISSRSGAGTVRRMTEKEGPLFFPVADMSASRVDRAEDILTNWKPPHNVLWGD